MAWWYGKYPYLFVQLYEAKSIVLSNDCLKLTCWLPLVSCLSISRPKSIPARWMSAKLRLSYLSISCWSPKRMGSREKAVDNVETPLLSQWQWQQILTSVRYHRLLPLIPHNLRWSIHLTYIDTRRKISFIRPRSIDWKYSEYCSSTYYRSRSMKAEQGDPRRIMQNLPFFF